MQFLIIMKVSTNIIKRKGHKHHSSSHYKGVTLRLERQAAHLIEQALQNNAALLLTAPDTHTRKGCYEIATAAEKARLVSLRPLINVAKPAGARSIFLFLIGPLLLP